MNSDNAITIRQAIPDDAVSMHNMLQGLAQALGLEGQNRGTVDDLLRYGFSGDAYFKALIAEREHQAVGLCTYFPIFSTWTGKPGIFVLDLFVDEKERGSQLGERLLSEIASLGRKRGAAFLRLSVDNHNVRGQGFYRRIGFKVMDDERSYQINTEKFEHLADQV